MKFNLNTTLNNAFLNFSNSNLTNAIILDNTNNTIYNEIKINGNSEFVVAARQVVALLTAWLAVKVSITVRFTTPEVSGVPTMNPGSEPVRLSPLAGSPVTERK